MPVLTSLFEVTERAYRPSSRIALHAHDRPSMSLVLAGGFRETMGGTSEALRPFSVSFMPRGVPHADDFSSLGARLLTITFNDNLDRELKAYAPAFDTWLWLHHGPVLRAFVDVLRAVRRPASPAALELTVIDTIAASTTGMSRGRRTRAPQWLARVREAIDCANAWPKVGDLAADTGVHRVYLARQFRRFYGCTVSEYVRQRFLQRAASQIGIANRPLSEIAHANGFSDQAHMCRTFRRETGLTPSAFRHYATSPPNEPK